MLCGLTELCFKANKGDFITRDKHKHARKWTTEDKESSVIFVLRYWNKILNIKISMNEQYAIIFQRNSKLLTEWMMKQRGKIRFISQVS